MWNILLIEDDEDDYVLTRSLLLESHKETFELVWAATFEAGLEQIKDCKRFDAILVDYHLGSKTGLELVRQAVERNCPIPFILLTAYGGYDLDVEAMQAGVYDYLNKKDVTAVLLERTIRYAIQRRHTNEQIASSIQSLKFLTDSAVAFLAWTPEQDIFGLIAQQLEHLQGDNILIVSEYDPDKNCTVVRAILAKPSEREKAIEVMGGDPVGLELPFAEAVRDVLQAGKLVRVEGGLHELSFGTIPLEICNFIEQELGLGQIYAIPFSSSSASGADFLGTLAVLTHTQSPPANAATLEAFAGQAGLVLKRWRAGLP